LDTTENPTNAEVAAQRRLWFLQIVLDKMEPEKALELATRMETFVLSGTPMIDPKDQRAALQTAGASLSAKQVQKSGDHAARQVLNAEQLREFTDLALQGSSNDDLAKRFELTPRQANGIRMGVAKRVPQVALKPPAVGKPKTLNHGAIESRV
jgi:hypothetical protein